ncbi:putative opsin [Russula aff. rugulosa BPL654]|nr:putative opsin [Russula aff. rugulosa BPL654]
MANASAKRIASQNEAAIKNMLYGHLLGNLLPLLIRILFRWQAFQQSKKAIVLYCVSVALSQFLYQHLKRMGTPRRDSTGNLVSPGDDLNQPGMTEWTFDVLYISWIAQLGSAILGEWFWLIYITIPTFVLYKLWSVVSPMLLGRSSTVSEEEPKEEGLSKRQEKLKKRSDRGDPRVKAQVRK